MTLVNCELVRNKASEFLDGELSPTESVQLERHVETCGECTALVASLRAVIERARTLPSSSPPHDLWPGIESRLEPRRAWWRRMSGAARGLDPAPGRGRQWAFSVPQLAAAGVLLMLLSGGAVWMAMSVRPGLRAGAGTVGQTSAPARPVAQASGTSAVSAEFGFARYDAAIAELERVLREHHSELDTATVRVIEQNLVLIDQATAQAQRALAADPANPYLNGHLADQMRRKVDLLRQAATAVSRAQHEGPA